MVYNYTQKKIIHILVWKREQDTKGAAYKFPEEFVENFRVVGK